MKHIVTILAALTWAPLARPQTPTTLLRSGEPIPGIATDEFSSLDWLGTNHAGGLVANITGFANGTWEDILWGSVGGGALGELRREGPQGAVTITSISRECAGAGASHTYFGNVPGMGESLMVDSTRIASNGEATAPGGETWIRFDEPFLDDAGDVWVRGQHTSPSGSRYGLFRGASLTPVLQAGDVVPGHSDVVGPGGGPNAEYDVAHDGARWMGIVTAADSRKAVVLNGSVLTAGGPPLLTGVMLPGAFAQSPNERYINFEQVQVAGGGHWAVIATSPEGMIIRDDALFVRDDHVIDGVTLTGEMRSIAMNRLGGLAWVGRVELGSGERRNAVFRERELLYMEGDGVDIDGDGIADPGWTISSLDWGAGGLAYTEDGRVWAAARLATPMGGTPIAVLGLGDPFGTPYCTTAPNSTGREASMQAVGSPVLSTNGLHVRCVDMPGTTFGYFLTSRTQGFVMNAGGSQGNLCLGGAVGRFNASISNSGAIGSIELHVDLTAIPQPNGAVAATVGENWSFQCWFRDANPNVTSNFSNGIEVTLL